MDRDKKAPVAKIDDISCTWESIIEESQDKLVGKIFTQIRCMLPYLSNTDIELTFTSSC